jgi:lysozyme
MNLSKLQAQLRLHEGVRKFPYVDSVGKTTIGIGHNLTDKGISQAVTSLMFTEDITDTINFLNTHLPWYNKLDEVRQRALADMTFDLMAKVLDFKKMLAHLQAQEWDAAAAELLNSTFAVQVDQRAVDLAFMIKTGKDV